MTAPIANPVTALRRIAAFAGIAGAFLCAQPALAEVPPAPHEIAQPDMAKQSLRMVVPVMVNGEGPFDFIIDTGSDRSAISTELAERLALPRVGRARVHAFSGTADVPVMQVGLLAYSDRTRRDLRLPAMKRSHIGADGLLGIDSLGDQLVTMDFTANTIRIEPSPRQTGKTSIRDGVIVVTAHARLGQLIMADADANGEKVWVIVDTGAQGSVGNEKLRMLLRPRHRDGLGEVEMLDVIGGRTKGDYTHVRALRLGGMQVGNPAVAFAEAYPFRLFGLTGRPSLLLGMETLSVFERVSIDFATRQVTFQIDPRLMNGTPILPGQHAE
jgi:hypothetical protein